MRNILLASAMALMATAPTLAPVDAAAQPRGYYEESHHRRHDNGDRDNRREHWNRQRHNGYYYRHRFHYGPPPAAYYSDPSFQLGYAPWRRGARLPVYYRERFYVVRDWGDYDLRSPPRGCHWVRDDRGDFLLVAIATGIIVSVVLDNGY